MKRALLLGLVTLSACDWDAAEEKARCVRDAPECGAVDAGLGDAGAPDAGVNDAGVADAGRRSDVTPIGLYPATAERVWLVANVHGVPRVELHTFGGTAVTFDAGTRVITSAYAHGFIAPYLAVLSRDAADAGFVAVFSESAGVIAEAPVSGTNVSIYLRPPSAEPTVSVWSTEAGQYWQGIYDATDLFDLGGASSPCALSFVDLEVTRPDAGDLVALVYESGPVCDGTGRAEGVSPSLRGVQTITANGTRRSLSLSSIERVGRAGAELHFLQRTTNGFFIRRMAWNAMATQFDPLDGGMLTASAPIRAGDLSEFAVTGTTTTNVSLNGGQALTVAFGEETAFAGHLRNGWLRSLGAVQPNTRVPVLGTTDGVFVLWAPVDGGLQFSALSEADGSEL